MAPKNAIIPSKPAPPALNPELLSALSTVSELPKNLADSARETQALFYNHFLFLTGPLFQRKRKVISKQPDGYKGLKGTREVVTEIDDSPSTDLAFKYAKEMMEKDKATPRAPIIEMNFHKVENITVVMPQEDEDEFIQAN